MARIPSPLRNAANLFAGSDSVLGNLFRHAQHLSRLQTLVDDCVSPSSRGHLKVASYDDELLMLVVASAGRAATLRYRETELTRSLRNAPEFRRLKRIRFIIRPELLPENRSRPRKPLSDKAARQISSSARYIEDARLRKALIKLSERRTVRD